MDRRINKTKQSIKNSFLELLKTRDVRKVTVTDVCRIADINRATFYAYYQDIPDLYECLKEELSASFISALSFYHFDMDSNDTVNRIFDCIKEHHELFLLLSSSNNPNEILSLIPSSMKNNAIDIWLKESNLTYEEADMLFSFITAGGNAILLKWIQSDFSMNEESVKQLFENAIKYGLYNFVYTK